MSISTTLSFPPPLTSGSVSLTMSRVQSKNERESKKRILATMIAARNRYDMKAQVAIRGWLAAEQHSLRERFGMVGKAEDEEQLDERFQHEMQKLQEQQKEKSLVLRGQLQKMEATMKELSKGELNPSRPPMLPISTYGVDVPLYSQSLCSLLTSSSSSTTNSTSSSSNSNSQHKSRLPSVASVASYVCTSIIPNMCITFEHPTVATGLGSLRSVDDLVSTAVLIGEELMGPLLQGLHNSINTTTSTGAMSPTSSASSYLSRDVSAKTLSRVCWVESFKMLIGASGSGASGTSESTTTQGGVDEGLVFGSPLRPSTVHAGALDPTHVAPHEEQLYRCRAAPSLSSSVWTPPHFNGHNAKQRLLLLLETCPSNLVILLRSKKVKAAIAAVYGSSSALEATSSKDFALAAAPLLTIMVTSHVSHQSYTPPSSPHNPNPRADLLADLLWPYFEQGDAIVVGEVQGTVRCPTFESITPNMAATPLSSSSNAIVGDKRPRDGEEAANTNNLNNPPPVNLLLEASQGALLTSGARWLLQYVNSTVNSAVLRDADVDNTIGVDMDDRRNIATGAVETLFLHHEGGGGGASKLCYSKRAVGIPIHSEPADDNNTYDGGDLVTSWRDSIVRRGSSRNSSLDAEYMSPTSVSSSGRVSYTLIQDSWDETVISGCSRPAKMIRVKGSSVTSSPLGGAAASTTPNTSPSSPSPQMYQVVQLTSQFALTVLCAESTFARLWAYGNVSSLQQQQTPTNWLYVALFSTGGSSSASIAEHMWSNRQSFIQAKYFSGDPQRPPTTGPASVFLHQLSLVDKLHKGCSGDAPQPLGCSAVAPSAGGIPLALGKQYGSAIVGPKIETPFIQLFHSKYLPARSSSAALTNGGSKLTSSQLEEVLNQQRNYCCPASIVALLESGGGDADDNIVGGGHWVPNPVFRGYGMSSSEESHEEDDALQNVLTSTPSLSPNAVPFDLATLRQQVRNLQEQHKRDNNDDAQEMLHRVMQTTSNSLMAQALNSGNGDDTDGDGMDITPPENVLFVCKLSPLTTAKGLSQIFSQFGTVLACDVITMPAGAREMTVAKQNYDAGSVSSGGGVVVGGQVRVNVEGRKSAKYAFVEFDTVDACNAAFSKMDGVMIDDTRIHVDFSQSTSNVLLQELHQQRAKNKAAAAANKKGTGGGERVAVLKTTTNNNNISASNSDALLGMLRGLPSSK